MLAATVYIPIPYYASQISGWVVQRFNGKKIPLSLYLDFCNNAKNIGVITLHFQPILQPMIEKKTECGVHHSFSSNLRNSFFT